MYNLKKINGAELAQRPSSHAEDSRGKEKKEAGSLAVKY